MLQQAINRISEIFSSGAWAEWFAQLDRPFIFLLSLPFVVAVVGLWAAYRERELERDEARSRPAARSRAADEDATDSSHRSPHQFGGKPHGNLTD